MNSLIEGVQIIPLKRHRDGRGWFQEIVRIEDLTIGKLSGKLLPDYRITKFGQLSHSMMHQGVIKAWHLHKIQTDWWYCPFGNIKAVLYDTRTDSETVGQLMSLPMGQDYEPIVLKIPPGVAHGLKVLQGPASLIYVTSHIYNPNDELRIPYNDSSIGYDWFKEVIK